MRRSNAPRRTSRAGRMRWCSGRSRARRRRMPPARFAARVPLLANMVEGGQTPLQSADELAQRGFRIVIYPGGTARAVAHTLLGYYASLHTQGSTAPWRDRMLDFDALNGLIGTPE